MRDILIRSASYTAILIGIIPIFGLILNYIIENIAKVLYRTVGIRLADFILNRLTFLGTVHHELSHALFAVITGAKVTKIDLFHPSGCVLGKVSMYTRGNAIIKSIQLTMSAIAPMICGSITLYIMYSYFSVNKVVGWKLAVIIYIMTSIFLHMTMSTQDIKNAIKGLPVCSLIIFVIISAIQFLK